MRMDEDYLPVDSIFQDGSIEVPAPEVDSEGVVQGSYKTDITAEIDSVQVKKYRDRCVNTFL